LKNRVIFEDDFESGNRDKWNSQYTSGGGVITVTNTNPYCGNFSARFQTPFALGSSYAALRRNPWSTGRTYTELYVEACVYIAAGLPLPGGGERFYLIEMATKKNGLGMSTPVVQIYNTGGIDKWGLYLMWQDPIGTPHQTDVFGSSSVQPNRWYKLLLYWRKGTNGLVELYVDGKLEIRWEGNTYTEGNICGVNFGTQKYAWGLSYATDIYGDEFLVYRKKMSDIQDESPKWNSGSRLRFLHRVS
jgi:hypothetical protein